MHVSWSFLLLLDSLSLSINCGASPLPDSPKPSLEMRTWGRRDEPRRVHLGYRYVNKESVLDYARAGRELEEAAGNVIKANAPEGKEADWVIEGTLTEIKASAVILGEGAYLTPVLGGWKGDFVCEVWADLEKFKETPNEYLTDDMMERYSGLEEELGKMLSKKQKKMDRTILAARLIGGFRYAMRIPPYYLKPSPLTGRRGRKGDLGITVRCVSQKNTQALSIQSPADWGQWWPELNPRNLYWRTIYRYV
ncbi:hypothetical protein F5879DRAFT_607623 [Lentinula edodes]|nr:hypothetical protein HHX47_DHR2000168 [Lentinula edodes]KAJ3898512.1 hypothetical protein F5879DRAFT_607623 [Lentinula edodes]